MDKRNTSKWVMVTTGAAVLAAVLYTVTVTGKWSWFDAAMDAAFVICGVVLVAKGLRR